MALTRAFLRGMNLTDEQVSAIIEAHTESTDSLKAQRDTIKEQMEQYKAEANKLVDVQKKLNDLKAQGDGGWQKKYEDEHSALEAYKNEVTAKETAAKTRKAYEQVLRDSGIADKYIASVLRASDISGVKLDESGKIADVAALTEKIKSDFGDFIPKIEPHGADVSAPPAPAAHVYTREEIKGMSPQEINAHWDEIKVALK